MGVIVDGGDEDVFVTTRLPALGVDTSEQVGWGRLGGGLGLSRLGCGGGLLSLGEEPRHKNEEKDLHWIAIPLIS